MEKGQWVVSCVAFCGIVLPLCHHVLRKFIHFLQIRLCGSCAAQPLESAVDFNESDIKVIDIPKIALQTRSQPTQHRPDNGHLFKSSDLYVRLAAPHKLKPKPDANALSFGTTFTDHMLKVLWHRNLGGWQKPEIIPLDNLVMHPAAKVLHYAVELYEGMKAYRGVDGRIRMFRSNMNMNRMNLTAKRSGLPTFDGDEFIKCLARLVSIDRDWIPHTEQASLYIRPTLIGIDPTLGVASSDSVLLYTILSPVGSYFDKSSTKTTGISLMADPQYTRAWPGGVGDRKMGSNYAPTIYVQMEAAKKGLQQVLWLYGEDHQLTEAGTMNIFMLFISENEERELVTPPLNGLILPGITRDSVLHLTRQWNDYKVSERSITMNQVCQLIKEGRLLEMFGTGTACVVSPIERIQYMGTDLLVPTLEHEKPLFGRILDTLTAIQYGKIDHSWAVAID